MRRQAKAPSSRTAPTGAAGRARRAVLRVALLASALAALAIPASATASPPALTMDAVTTHSIVTAHLSGTVEVPADGFETYWCLEYAEKDLENWSGFCYQGPIQPGESLPVETDVSGLKADTEYEARLSALNFSEGIEEHSGSQAFTTDPAPTAPTLVLGAASQLTRVHAHVEGSVDPNGGNVDTQAGPLPIEWRFEYTPALEPGNWQLGGSGTIEGAEAGSPPDPIEVSAELSGLKPATEYLYRLTATYAGGEAPPSSPPEGSFETLSSSGPTAATEPAIHVGTESAYLEGVVNPDEESTSYWFEYGPGNCATTTCTAVPATKRVAGDGATEVPASFGLGGLSPATTYHFRLLAENASGTAAGGDRTFTTQAAPGGCPNEARRLEQGSIGVLGNCRAWELTTPDTNKDIMADSGRTVAAADEATGLSMAVKFSSLGGFGEVEGSGIAFDYLAQRTGAPGTSGWGYRGITPLQEPLSLQGGTSSIDPLYWSFSPDLTQGLFRSFSSLPGTSENSWEVSNLYRRDDLRAAGAGTYQPLTDSFFPQSPQTVGNVTRPSVAGTSSDLRHVLFETTLNLTADAAGPNTKLYKSDDGVVKLVRASTACAGVGTNLATAADVKFPCGRAGLGATQVPGLGGPGWYTPRVISDDGARVNFTSPFGRSESTVPNDTPGVVSRLYQLDDRGTASTDDDALIQLSMSEKGSPELPRRPIYETASTDGDRVFFRSAEQLTETPGGGLYMWERQGSNETQNLVIDAAAGSFTVTAHSQPSYGSGELTEGSTTVFMKGPEPGSFTVGQTIRGEGLPDGATVTEVGTFAGEAQSKIVISAPATETATRSLSASFEATTGPLAWNASAAEVQAALEGLELIGTGNVAVSGGPGGSSPYTVEFIGALGGINMLPLTTDAAGLSGGASAATVATTADVHNLTLIAPGGGDLLGASEDGHHVYFTMGDEFWYWQDGGTPPGGTLSYVTTVPATEGQNQTFGLTNFWNSKPPISRVTPDGRSLLFEASSGTGLPPAYQHGPCPNSTSTGAANGLCSEAYVYHADSSTPTRPDIVCASCKLAEPESPGDTFPNARKGAGASVSTSHLNRALSDDGRRVFFNTPEALAPEDTNGTLDVYEYDAQTGEASLVSGGTDSSPSYLMDASADGSDVFVVTRARLSRWDDDSLYDLYDARVDGGFPEPPVGSAPCAGDECREAASPAPGSAAIGSAAVSGPGNPRIGRRCPKGRRAVRRHGKVHCVKKHRRGHHKRTADTNRRAGK